ncbi:hypothetical protein FACS189454_04130 [Planctomycetales bacterium]|nr:hypothetical protein FACS189454_04130 [Planctomycetales bacterium]
MAKDVFTGESHSRTIPKSMISGTSKSSLELLEQPQKARNKNKNEVRIEKRPLPEVKFYDFLRK